MRTDFVLRFTVLSRAMDGSSGWFGFDGHGLPAVGAGGAGSQDHMSLVAGEPPFGIA